MQPRILWTTLALGLAASGLAYGADDRHGDQKASPSHATSVSLSREQTMQMQRALKSRNIYQGQVDGVWGPKTESALRNFQTQSGLEATGELNDSTAQALGMDMTNSSASGTTMGGERQTVSGTDRGAEVSPPAVGTATTQSPAQLEDGKTNLHLTSLSQEQAREMQQRLQLLGYYRGPVDGKIGEGTRAALASYFQRQAELARQGVISNSAISLFGTEVDDVQSGRDTPAR